MRKLYYEDSSIQSFHATVTACRQAEAGYEVELSATAFYPEGGGQACDLGNLDGIPVLDVQERAQTVVHLCQAPLEVGKTVQGQIDWQRRLDLMQQHTGEHIVSGIVHRLFGYQNVGFHVGADVMEVDFDGPIPAEALQEIVRLANEAVWQDLPVKCWVPSPEELPSVTYRTKRALPWPVRIVQVGDVDSCACCGVHTKTTGQVGLISIFSCVKFHQGVRLEMACGRRALDMLHRVYEQNRQVSQAFSARILETGQAARQINEALSQEKYRAVSLEKQLFTQKARMYAGCSRAVVFEPDLNPNQIRTLAQAISAHCPLAAVFSPTGNGHSFCLAGTAEPIQALGKQLAEQLGARGGGKPGFYQGNIPATQSAIEDFFARIEA